MLPWLRKLSLDLYAFLFLPTIIVATRVTSDSRAKTRIFEDGWVM